MSIRGIVRKPAVSGMFYPGEPEALQRMIGDLLAATGTVAKEGRPKGLVVPHAGYVYSGQVAAEGFVQLKPWTDAIRRVVLMGPSHYHTFAGLAAPEARAMATPLGDVPVEQPSGLITCPYQQSDRVHAREHCLEVELPFLQCVLRAFRIVPLLTGVATAKEMAEALDALWGDDATLLVISTDLSHFHNDTAARRMDAVTCRAIESLDAESLSPDHACGFVALRGLLRAAQAHGLQVRTLAMRNSGDATGDRSRVVGYGAWAFYASS